MSPEEIWRNKSTLSLSLNGFYYPKMGRIGSCHHSTVLRALKCFEKAGSPKEQKVE